MKARFAYPLLFIVPSFTVALVAAVIAAGAISGALWIFVYGDDPWPDSAETLVLSAFVVVLVCSLSTLTWAGYSFGKRQELLGGLNWKHVLVAIALTIVLPGVVLLRQWGIGALDF